ncbi:MAG TPA: hypothetical protein VIS06_11540, partial [Mycobacteriales bacterium]
MPEHNTAADLRARIAALEKAVRQLQANNRMASSAIRGGTLLFQDETGQTRVAFGQVAFDGTVGATDHGYGAFQFDENGAFIQGQLSGFRGLMYPSTPFQLNDSAGKTVTSPTFTNLFFGEAAFPVSDTLLVGIFCHTDPGTTGEIRLNTTIDATDPVVLPAGMSGNVQFEWLHPSTTGIFDPRTGRQQSLYVQLEARRTAGTGNVTVFAPTVCELTSSWLVPTAT